MFFSIAAAEGENPTITVSDVPVSTETQSDTTAETSEDTSKVENPAKEKSYVPEIIVAVICVLLVAVVLVLWKKKRKKPASEAALSVDNPEETTLLLPQDDDSLDVSFDMDDRPYAIASGVSYARDNEGGGVVAAIFDSLEKSAKGVDLARFAAEEAEGAFLRQNNREAPNIRMLRSFVETHNRVRAKVKTDKSNGCVAAFAQVIYGCLYFATAGNDIVALARGGELLVLNRIHNFSYENDENVEVNGLGKKRGPVSTRVTSWLGTEDLYKVDRNENPIRLQKGDRILLLSYEVFVLMNADRMVQLVAGDIHGSAKALLDEARTINPTVAMNNAVVIGIE